MSSSITDTRASGTGARARTDLRANAYAWVPVLFSAVLAAALAAPRPALAVSCKAIQFEDIKPKGQTLNWVWQAVGVDSRDGIHLISGGARDGKLDCAWFRYDHKTGERKLVGSLREIIDSAGNLKSGESIAKGHSGISEFDGVMYTGTMEFHDADDYNTSYRGSHIISYDVATGKADDEARHMPDGVFQPHQGAYKVAAWPEEGLVVATSTPYVDLILYDPKTREVEIVKPFGTKQNNLMREVITAPNRKVYFGAGWTTTTLHSYDRAIGKTQATDMKVAGGFVNAMAQTRDRYTVYLTTIQGGLYKLDLRTETSTKLADLPVQSTMALALDPHDEKLFAVATRGGDGNYAMYEYDIATKKLAKVANVGCGMQDGNWWVSGSNVRTSDGYIYFGVGRSTDVRGPSFLLQVDIRDRMNSPPDSNEPDPNAGLPARLAHYKLDDTGDKAVDASGNGKNGIIHGSPKRVQGVKGTAIDLDGVDDYVELPVALPDQGSISLWYYPDAYYNYNTVFDNSLFHNDWEMWIQGDRINESWYSCPYCWRFRLGGNDQARDVGRASFDMAKKDPKAWYHAVVTWDQTGLTRLYLDGVLRDEATSAGFKPAGDKVFLGGGQSQNSKGKGIIDEVSIYGGVLSSSQVSGLYHAGKTTAIRIPASKKVLEGLAPAPRGAAFDISGKRLSPRGGLLQGLYFREDRGGRKRMMVELFR